MNAMDFILYSLFIPFNCLGFLSADKAKTPCV